MELHTDTLGDLAIVECDGPIAYEDAATQLWQEVTSHREARIIVLDLSEVSTMDDDGVSMLAFLQRWSQDRGIQLKLFNPRYFVRNGLERVKNAFGFEIVGLPEVMDLLGLQHRQARAA